MECFTEGVKEDFLTMKNVSQKGVKEDFLERHDDWQDCLCGPL